MWAGKCDVLGQSCHFQDYPPGFSIICHSAMRWAAPDGRRYRGSAWRSPSSHRFPSRSAAWPGRVPRPAVVCLWLRPWGDRPRDRGLARRSVQGSGQIGVKMYDKRGDGPPEPVDVNSSSGICSRRAVRNMREWRSELCIGAREDSNVNRIASSVHGL